MAEYPFPTAGGTPEDRLRLLCELLDRLPISVALHGIEEGLPLLYHNRRAEERLAAAPPGLAVPQLRHPQLRDLAERVVASRQPDHTELDIPGTDGRRLQWSWSMCPLHDRPDRVVALVSVVQELGEPVLARRRIESALDHGLHLLLEIARLAEQRPSSKAFLCGVSDRLAQLVQADRVTFNVYDPARKALVANSRSDASDSDDASPSSLPCDPAASDLLSQVVFGGRVYRGPLDVGSLQLRPYARLAQPWREPGTKVLIVPWRAGNERLGAVMASGPRRKEGFTEESTIVLIAAGHAAGMVWQRKRAEQQLADRAHELELLERAKSNFLMLASHELRTPLTVLNGYVSMLADGSQGPERLGEILPILQQALGRMNVLVDQLMEATRLADSKLRLRRQPVDLRTVVESAANRSVARWHRDQDFALGLPGAAVPATVDVLRLETAVENLVDNAFKYSEPGGRVSCELRIAEDVARLAVQDEGIGMSEDEMVVLFTRFGRIVNAQNGHIDGTGLGLFLSRETARSHGGDITVTSVTGRGSRFELTLPLTEPSDGGGGQEST